MSHCIRVRVLGSPGVRRARWDRTRGALPRPCLEARPTDRDTLLEVGELLLEGDPREAERVVVARVGSQVEAVPAAGRE